MRRPRTILSTLAVLAVLGQGCVRDGPPVRTPPRPVPAQPTGLVPVHLLLAVSPVLSDTDRNGFVDTMTTTIYLFASGYDLAITAPGSFEFVLQSADGETLRTWLFDVPSSEAAVKKFMAGPAYVFELSLRNPTPDGEPGADQLPGQKAQLLTRFIPVAGEPVRPRASTTVVVGPAPGSR